MPERPVGETTVEAQLIQDVLDHAFRGGLIISEVVARKLFAAAVESGALVPAAEVERLKEVLREAIVVVDERVRDCCGMAEATADDDDPWCAGCKEDADLVRRARALGAQPVSETREGK